MYLHIGKDVSVYYKHIIGIFDIDSLKRTKTYDKICETMKNDIIDISEGNNKTIILLKDKTGRKAYISNILSITLEKRITENKYDG